MANEKRLIEVAPLIDECKECMNIEWNKSVYTTWAEAEEDFMQRLLDAPTVDAVEVVRCKDCKHWHEETGWCNQHSHFIGEKGEACHPWESNDWKMLNEDDFCSYGERKTNESTDH